MVKISSPADDDAERLAERIWRESGYNIRTEKQYNYIFDDYIGEERTSKQNTTLRKAVKEKIMARHSNAMSEVHKGTGRARKWEKVQGFDYQEIGYVINKKTRKKQVVQIRADTITTKGKRINIFRDSKGRFAKAYHD